MRLALLYISIFVSLTVSAQLVVTDVGLKTCYNTNYGLIMLNDSTMDIAAANAYTGNIVCEGIPIKDISSVAEFHTIWGLNLDSVETNELDALLGMANVEQLIIKDSKLDSFPDLSQLPKLNFLNANRAGLKVFPLLPSGIDIVQLDENEIGTVNFVSSFPELGNLQLMENNITSFTGLENLPQLDILLLGGNQLETIPDVSPLTNITTLQLFNNDLKYVEGIENLPKLEVLHITGAGLTELPLVDLNTINRVNLAYNHLTFEDLLPIAYSPAFPDGFPDYGSQHRFGTDREHILEEGEYWTLKLDFDDDVSSSTYYWYLNNNLIDSTTTNELIFESIKLSDAGTYTCHIKNDLLPDLTVKTFDISVIVNPTVNREESSAFSPNGDGKNDLFQIEEAGSVKIFTEKGRLVKELEAPGFWDGTDSADNPVPFGYYIISIDGGNRFGVTVVR